jgi:hypothetical protein
MRPGPRDVDGGRRRLLTSLGAAAISGVLAGCTSEEADPDEPGDAEPDEDHRGDDEPDDDVPTPTETEEAEETPTETLESVGPVIEVTGVGFDDREIIEGEAIEIEVEVENEGDASGIYTVELTANGEVVQAEDVRVEPEETRTVAFRLTITSPGEYEIGVGDETETVLVEPEPPEFEVREATVETETSVGESVEASALVANTGGPGTFEAALEVDGEVVAETAVEIDREDEETVTFDHEFDERGRYEVRVADEVAGTVAVEGCETLVSGTETVGWRESLRYAIEFEEEGSLSLSIESETGRDPTLTVTDPSGEAVVDGQRDDRLEGTLEAEPGEYGLLLENTATFPFSDGQWAIDVAACSVGDVSRVE